MNEQETIVDIIAEKRLEADYIEETARGSLKAGENYDGIAYTESDLESATAKDNHMAAFPIQLPDGRLLDVFLRMLKVDELAAAHSFPKGYIFTGTKTEQTKQIGNSVPVRTAKALVLAALSDFRKTKAKEK